MGQVGEANPLGISESPSSASIALVPAQERLPATLRQAPVLEKRPRSRLRILLFVALLGVGAAAGGRYWWLSRLPPLPQGIVWSNGRIEAEEIDISTKFAGRIAQLAVQEGDMVAPGQVIARMDTRDLEASLKKAEAQVLQGRRNLEEARALVAQQETEVTLAKAEFERASALLKRGFTTRQAFDQRQQALNSANAKAIAARARVNQAEYALEAAQHEVELYEVNIADNTLIAPREGRIQYRIANVGEVLPVGGKVFTMLDIADVYMNVYLPTADAGRAKVGSDARVVLDAYPNFAAPAYVSFVATQAQFTPKAVETKSERDKLMFRVKVRIDPDLLRRHAAEVRTGLPGIAYVRLDPKAEWPERLAGPKRQ
ncbi:HlyD family efflux transporter periplasmic adaptor subunit [Methylocapsa aurea]|uniref:HlyD family secretion protein n=1 Tax=Methylocapsa aurea TaxID=663610 RepID=UPI0005628EF4